MYWCEPPFGSLLQYSAVSDHSFVENPIWCKAVLPMHSIGMTKSQAPISKQAPMAKIQITKTFCILSLWNFEFIWYLLFGFWNFRCCAAVKGEKCIGVNRLLVVCYNTQLWAIIVLWKTLSGARPYCQCIALEWPNPKLQFPNKLQWPRFKWPKLFSILDLCYFGFIWYLLFVPPAGELGFPLLCNGSVPLKLDGNIQWR